MTLTPCPECGAKAYIQRDEPDGFFMGWSVGCPRYRQNDGIHKHTMAFHGFDTKYYAEMFWLAYVKGMEGKDNG